MRQLEQDRPNRAVTAFYQVFGGRWKRLPGEAVHMAEGPGHHRTEKRELALSVPAVTGAAVFDALWRLGGRDVFVQALANRCAGVEPAA